MGELMMKVIPNGEMYSKLATEAKEAINKYGSHPRLNKNYIYFSSIAEDVKAGKSVLESKLNAYKYLGVER